MIGSTDLLVKEAHSLVVSEGAVNPLGFHDAMPTFSWKLPEGTRKQTAYHIELHDGHTQKVLWDSDWVESDQSLLVAYSGEALVSRQRVLWRVRFRNEDGVESQWSAQAHFELGLLNVTDWHAQWIAPRSKVDPEREAVSYLRRSFCVEQPIKQARLYVTARGIFNIELNGQRVSNDYFANGWTAYDKRIDTLTYDVTDVLQANDNSILAMLGAGWYAGRIAWLHDKKLLGRRPELLFQLEILYADGSRQMVVSDQQWEGTTDGPILSSGLYEGEYVDARRQITGWEPVYAESDLGVAKLVPKPFAPVRAIETRAAQAVSEPEAGRYVFDLGQNMVGWPKLTVPLEQGKPLRIRFAEMLNADGTLYTENYRSAKSEDSYIAAETGEVTWEPMLTFHGFRYVELSGFAATVKPKADWVKGIVLHTDLKRIGQFESSNALLNRLQSNIVWGQRGNFLDIPTDCPQRDERLGWTGDAQVFCATAMFNYDCHAFWKSWLGSMRDEQMADGRIPHIIPDILLDGGSPGWVDAAWMIPWDAYVRTGDLSFLADNFPMMEKLAAWYKSQFKGARIETMEGFGDWLQPHAETLFGDTPKEFLGMAFYCRGLCLMESMAALLKDEHKVQHYGDEARAVKEAFALHYFDDEGCLQNAVPTQTAYLLAIAFDLIPESLQQKSGAQLLALVDEADGHLRTGFLGTPYITAVLDKVGQPDAAFKVLLKESYPSWFYSILQGATTMWERWNSYSHADGFGDVTMNSFNHYAYGAVGQWLYERVAGLSPDPSAPGYKHFYLRPLIGGGLTYAKASLDTPYGLASSSWKLKKGIFEWEVVVPPNTRATLEFPTERLSEVVSAGKYSFRLAL